MAPAHCSRTIPWPTGMKAIIIQNTNILNTPAMDTTPGILINILPGILINMFRLPSKEKRPFNVSRLFSRQSFIVGDPRLSIVISG